MSTFAATTTTRIPLSGGQWIEVKDELSRGDRIRIWALSTSRDAEGNTYADPEKVPNAKPLAFIVAWSLGVPVTAEALNALSEAFGAELAAAIQAHEAAQEKKRLIPDGESPSPMTSPSAS